MEAFIIFVILAWDVHVELWEANLGAGRREGLILHFWCNLVPIQIGALHTYSGKDARADVHSMNSLTDTQKLKNTEVFYTTDSKALYSAFEVL